MITTAWTEHEAFFVETMACRLKLARLDDQAQAIWSLAPCGPPPFSLQEALVRQCWALETYRINLHPPLKPPGPILTLGRQDHLPNDLRPYSKLVRARWNKGAIPTTVVVPTRAAANLFGSTAYGLPPIDHRDHDALLTDALVCHLQQQPQLIDFWQGEQMRDKAGYRIKDPDAFILRPDGSAYEIIESAGAYSARQLASLCDYFLEREQFERLEIW